MSAPQTIRDVVVKLGIEYANNPLAAFNLDDAKRRFDDLETHAKSSVDRVRAYTETSRLAIGGIEQDRLGGGYNGFASSNGHTIVHANGHSNGDSLSALRQSFGEQIASLRERADALKIDSDELHKNNAARVQSIGLLKDQAEAALKLTRGIGLIGASLGLENSNWLRVAAAGQGAMDVIDNVGGVATAAHTLLGLGGRAAPNAAEIARGTMSHTAEAAGAGILETAGGTIAGEAGFLGLKKLAGRIPWGGAGRFLAQRVALPLTAIVGATYAGHSIRGLVEGHTTDGDETLFGAGHLYDAMILGDSARRQSQLEANRRFWSQPLENQRELSQMMSQSQNFLGGTLHRNEFMRHSGLMTNDQWLGEHQRLTRAFGGWMGREQLHQRDDLSNANFQAWGAGQQAELAKQELSFRREIIAELEKERASYAGIKREAEALLHAEQTRLQNEKERLGMSSPQDLARLNAIGQKLAKGGALNEEEARLASQYGLKGADNQVGKFFDHRFSQFVTPEAQRALGMTQRLEGAEAHAKDARRNFNDAMPEIEGELQEQIPKIQELNKAIGEYMRAQTEFQDTATSLFKEHSQKLEKTTAAIRGIKTDQQKGVAGGL